MSRLGALTGRGPAGGLGVIGPTASRPAWTLRPVDATSTRGPVLDGTLQLPALPQMITFFDATGLLTVAHDGQVQLWNLRDPRHPSKAVSLGTADFPTTSTGLGAAITSPGVTTAAGLVTVQSGGRLVLWRVTGALTATREGSLPLPDPASDIAGLVGGSTACVITSDGVTWWDIHEPSHPVLGGTSAVKQAYKGSLIGTSDVAAATSGVSEDGVSLSLFALHDGRPRSTVRLPGLVNSTLGLSDDGHLLAAGGAGDNALTLWDVSDPVHPHLVAVTGTPTGTSGIAFAPSDRLMADWSNNEAQVQLWSLHAPSPPALLATLTPPAFTALQVSASSSPTSETPTAATDNSVSLYDTNPDRLATTLCS